MALQISLPNPFIWFYRNNPLEEERLRSEPVIRDYIKFIKPRVIEIIRFPITIGRNEGNNIIINHSTVSRRHAEIVCRGVIFKSYFIRDLGSKNKSAITRKSGGVVSLQDTFVKVNSGDRINLGSVVLRIL